MSNLLLYAVLLFLAFMATEGTVEYVLGTLFDKVAALTPFKWGLMYVSLAIGIFLAFYYALDVMAFLGLPASPVGMVLTGVIIGRGANFVSNVWQRFFGTVAQRYGTPSSDPEDDFPL